MAEQKFTPRAENVLRLAQETALELGHGYVGSEHLLLGLASQEYSAAARSLQSSGVDSRSLRSAISQLVGTGVPARSLHQGLTPKSFFEKYVGVDLSDYVSLINAPTEDKPYGRSYTVQCSYDRGGDAVTTITTPEELAGISATVSGSDRVSVEIYILDFEGDLYDHTVRVEFHHFIRDERKFSGVDELKAQILRDAETTREYFAS